MGRPSEIFLQMTIKNGALISAEIGGSAIMVTRGEIIA
jgi:trans-2,3-dihydro-3-hydroxyanthranilate isomerase